ncbi:MAG TPA: DUF3857 and transglutaminase domain-containing protein [Pyrinomonadaceae bacterium]|nr:DUF3857 and transglutaminase domain-containing protein [Pyrinomonadaceae bacterium]
MKPPRPTGRALALLRLAALVCLSALTANAADWEPVNPSDLALKTPVVDKDADAEAIFWRVRVDDASDEGLTFTHYVRVKIFTERGRESQSKVEIPYTNRAQVKDVTARTIKPDGTVVELKKSDVFDRTVVKVSGLRVKVKSFAVPGIEPGAIVEYRWREVFGGASANYTRLHFQRDIPVQQVSYQLKPYGGFVDASMRAHFFNMPGLTPKKVKDGFYELSMTNVPAFREEPHMPPADQVRSWTLVYYAPERKLEPAKFWQETGREFHEALKSKMKPNDEVKQAAAEAVGDATTPEQKLERLFNFVRAKVKNVYDDASGFTAAERAAFKGNKSPSETLKRGVGDGGDIDLLFGALATAAGFDARVAWTADRGTIFFDPSLALRYFLEPSSIAVRVGDQWRFYNPGLGHIPHGMLRWQEEGTATLIADPKEPVFVSTPMSGPEKSRTKRTAKLKLTADGTLEGEVTVEYTGHAAAGMREAYDEETPAEREESLKESVKSRLSTAELSDIKVENVTDTSKPFVYSYRIRVPGYAQRTGKRLFIQPAFFQRNVGPLFATSERRNDIYFHYAWSEEDDVEIELPEGYALDNAERPANFGSGDMSRYEVQLGVTKDERRLVYRRKFFFGGPPKGAVFDMNRLRFPAASYAPLKQYFDTMHQQDAHTISLKQGAATTAAAGSDPASKN